MVRGYKLAFNEYNSTKRNERKVTRAEYKSEHFNDFLLAKG